MRFKKEVSAVVVAYYSGDILFRAIDALLVAKNVVEVIVVNNGNPKDTTSKLLQDKRIKLITGQNNVGFAKACNLGAKVAKSDILLIINPDSIVGVDDIVNLLNEAENLSSGWMITPCLVGDDGLPQRGSIRRLLTPWLMLVEGLRLYKLAPNHPYFKKLNLHDSQLPLITSEIEAMSGAFMMLPRDDYMAMGGIDERYFLHVEDLDFCYNWRKKGNKIYFCPKIRVYHKGGTSDVSKICVEAHKARSFLRYIHKNFRGVYPLPILWFADLLAIAKFGVFLMRFSILKVKGLLKG